MVGRRVTLLLLVLLFHENAQAQNDPAFQGAAHGYHTSLSPQPVASVRVDAGVASALGFIGAAASYYPVRWVILEGGVGYGLTGAQFSGMVKLAYGSDSLRVVTGGGVAAGISGASNNAVWLNIDLVGAEYRTTSRFVFAFTLGFTKGLAGSREYCFDESCKRVRDVTVPQFRLGLGRWF